eukprot:TRINITY_DN12059_c0_g1_i1.p1 TRINITY_DN12059_c0_g1~~TRINITY_DN12059_c0_g1_i1.p1  ORF type:complete len:490 (+),score=102.61 TRINITY_DN12059_c0_g1_i1:194-1663(+)
MPVSIVFHLSPIHQFNIMSKLVFLLLLAVLQCYSQTLSTNVTEVYTMDAVGISPNIFVHAQAGVIGHYNSDDHEYFIKNIDTGEESTISLGDIPDYSVGYYKLQDYNGFLTVASLGDDEVYFYVNLVDQTVVYSDVSPAKKNLFYYEGTFVVRTGILTYNRVWADEDHIVVENITIAEPDDFGYDESNNYLSLAGNYVVYPYMNTMDTVSFIFYDLETATVGHFASELTSVYGPFSVTWDNENLLVVYDNLEIDLIDTVTWNVTRVEPTYSLINGQMYSSAYYLDILNEPVLSTYASTLPHYFVIDIPEGEYTPFYTPSEGNYHSLICDPDSTFCYGGYVISNTIKTTKIESLGRFQSNREVANDDSATISSFRFDGILEEYLTVISYGDAFDTVGVLDFSENDDPVLHELATELVQNYGVHVDGQYIVFYHRDEESETDHVFLYGGPDANEDGEDGEDATGESDSNSDSADDSMIVLFSMIVALCLFV